ncbi:MAG: hypothetical protein ABW189_09155 [Rickettsiales bacterium]
MPPALRNPSEKIAGKYRSVMRQANASLPKFSIAALSTPRA